MATLDVHGATLDYTEVGPEAREGDPVVLVHGSSSDRRTWGGQLGPFGERFRTIAYSRRYHWPNEPIPEGADYAMATHVRDLAGVIEGLGAAPAHLVGHSYGGFVSLMLAMERPGLVRSLVLAEPPAMTVFVSPRPGPGELLGLVARRPRAGVALARFALTGMIPATRAMRRGEPDRAMRIFGRAVLGRAFQRRMSADRRRQVRENTFAAELLGSGFPALEDDAIRGVRAPALLLRGGCSPAIFGCIVARLGELLPDARTGVIGGASHIMHEDEAGAFNRAVLGFLGERSEGARLRRGSPR